MTDYLSFLIHYILFGKDVLGKDVPRIRRTKFYSQQGKCIYQNSVSTYYSKLSVELSIWLSEYVTTKILLLKL